MKIPNSERCVNVFLLLLTIVSVSYVFIYRFTSWRIGHFYCGDTINEVLDSLSMNWIAVIIFHVGTDIIPQRRRRSKRLKDFSLYQRDLYAKFNQIVILVQGYQFIIGPWPNSKKEFCERFSTMDFTSNDIKTLEKLENDILQLCRDMQQFHVDVSEKDYKIVEDIQSSIFIHNLFLVKRPDVSVEDLEEIGDSIYDLYLQLKKSVQ